jgi:protein SCO1/2
MVGSAVWQYVLLIILVVFFGDGLQAGETGVEKNKLPTGIVEKTGDYLPGPLFFNDESGNRRELAELIDRPTIILPVYYRCPKICSFDMANLAMALQRTSRPADSFRVITVSFDEEENSEDASRAKNNYTALLGESYPEDSWIFLTGDRENILRLTEAIGYTFKRGKRGLFIHPSAMAVTSREGRIIKYVYGEFLVGDVDLALMEAQKNTPSASIKRFLAYCLEGDPARNKYFFNIVKALVIVVLMAGGYFLIRMLLKGNNAQ